MSRVSALLGKRNKNASVDIGKTSSISSKEDGTTSSSAASTPEKEKSNGTADLRRPREPSVIINGNESPSISVNGSKGPIRRQGSNSSMSVQHTTADGTPVVYDTTSDVNQVPGSNQLSEGPLNGRSNSNRRSTFSRGGPALALDTAHLPRSASVGNNIHEAEHSNNGTVNGHIQQVSSRQSAAYQPVGEGSLSLDAFLQNSQDSAVTPKAGHMQFSEDLLTSETPKPQLFVIDASPLPSPVPDMGASQSRRQVDLRYPPVFEVSDRGSSSSSSAGEGDKSDRPVIQLQRSHTNDSEVSHSATDGEDRGRSQSLGTTGSSLSPPGTQSGKSNTRGRSTSGASTSSFVRPSVSSTTSKSSSFPLRPAKSSKKGSQGIAGALALSGVALASPGPGVAHPFHMTARTTSFSKQRPPSEDDHSNANMNRNDISHPSPGDMPAYMSRSSEEAGGYESPTPLSTYTPNDSPRYEDDPAFQAMVSIDALGEFDDVVTQLGAGYALASSKRNAEFHSLFKHVPEEDYLIEDYGCALQREILIQGRLYISEHRLCFYANIFGWVTTLVLHFSEIVTIEKRNTALVIPNAIHIATMHSRHIFASFLSRDMTYELMTSLWKSSHPVVPPSAALPDIAVTEDDEDDFALSNAEDALPPDQLNGRKKRKMKKGRFKKAKNASGSAEAVIDGKVGELDVPVEADLDDTPAASQPRASMGTSQSTRLPVNPAHPPTQCDCTASRGGHYPNTIMDATFPGSPEKIYNLMFTSGFMRAFLIDDMKVADLQYGDWAPQHGSHLLSRTYNYIKPLSAPVGPKSAKCILTDENLHVDFDDFVVNMTTTKTPEVPSGGSFAVKTRTCLTWGKNRTTRVLVTTTMEWSGKSFIRGIIDRSSLDGQKTLYLSLEKSIRAYISAHKSEFYELGGDKDDEDDEVIHQSVEDAKHQRNISSGGASVPGSESGTGMVALSEQRKEPLAFVSDRVPFSKPICDFITTLYDTLADLMGQMSPSTLICAFIIAVLLASNIFTLSSLRKSSSRYVPQRRPPPDSASRGLPVSTVSEQGQLQVAEAVRGVLHEYFNLHNNPSATTAAPANNMWKGPVEEGDQDDQTLEATEIRTLLETLERRVAALKSTLDDLN